MAGVNSLFVCLSFINIVAVVMSIYWCFTYAWIFVYSRLYCLDWEMQYLIHKLDLGWYTINEASLCHRVAIQFMVNWLRTQLADKKSRGDIPAFIPAN